MDVYVLNQQFQTVSIIDAYESLIWTDRYSGYGDFEIYAPFSLDLLNKVRQDYYLTINDSEHVMIIEGLDIESNAETGNRLKITGRSLESLLDRRIIWQQTSYTGNLQNAIRNMLYTAFISPSIADRRVNNFVFEASTDTRITSLSIEEEHTGDNIYDVIKALCDSNYMGYKITLNDNNQFVFKLYMGEDRSYNQIYNPYVVFSPNYDNIINSNYLDSTELMKNVTLVAGEDSGQQRVTVVVGSGSGLTRRELFTDARDIQSEKVSNYQEALRQRGIKHLLENSRTVDFEGEVDATRLFVYGEDFYMGDVVQISNEYGIEGAARVVEFVRNEDSNGIKMYPTFEAVQNIDTTVG